MSPFLKGYLGCMLEDLQLCENEEACMEEREARDVGTIHTLPPETLATAMADCEAFQREANADACDDWSGSLNEAISAHEYDSERAGADFHLTRVGHGAGFWDRRFEGDGDPRFAAIGDRLTQIAHGMCNEGGYLGDDGRVYL